jgi:hypothetical protein
MDSINDEITTIIQTMEELTWDDTMPTQLGDVSDQVKSMADKLGQIENCKRLSKGLEKLSCAINNFIKLPKDDDKLPHSIAAISILKIASGSSLKFLHWRLNRD